MLATLLAASGCTIGEGDGPRLVDGGAEETDPKPGEGGISYEPGDVLQEKELNTILADGRREPLEMVVQATPPAEAKKTRTLDEAREELQADPTLAPLREALVKGGWDADQRAQMLYFAGTHMSGAPEDSIRHRQQKLHDQMSGQLEQFRQALADAEARTGVKVDRDALHDAGVITRLETEVIR